MNFSKVKMEIYVPQEYIESLRDELTKIGACQIGKYDHVISFSNVQGYWHPLLGSSPFNGEVGTINFGSECKLEVRCPITKVKDAVATIKKIHPYEEPVINIIPLINDMFEIE